MAEDKKTEFTDLDIKHFKLVSGDEIVGLIAGVKQNLGVMYLERPVKINFTGADLYLSDYMPTAKNNIVAFSMSHVVAQSDVIDSMKKTYIEFCLNAPEDRLEFEQLEEYYSDEYDEELEELETTHVIKKTLH